MLVTLDSLLCPCPLILDIDTDMSEQHLEPITISPHTLPGAGAGLPRTPKGLEVMAKRERGNRKDSVRDPRGSNSGHQNKLSHHCIKGKQQRSTGILSKMFRDSFTIPGEGPY